MVSVHYDRFGNMNSRSIYNFNLDLCRVSIQQAHHDSLLEKVYENFGSDLEPTFSNTC